MLYYESNSTRRRNVINLSLMQSYDKLPTKILFVSNFILIKLTLKISYSYDCTSNDKLITFLRRVEFDSIIQEYRNDITIKYKRLNLI